MAQVEDKTILAAKGGDREAFANLIREHHPRVILLCRSMLADAAEAEDAAQEIFIKVFQRLDRFDGRSRFSTWLHRLAANHCLDRLRKRARESSRPLEGLDVSDRESGTRASDARHDAGLLLACLSDEQRTAIILRELQGFSYEEIRDATGWSLDSVKARLRRAREKLTEKMRHFGGFPGV
jgi:RNA polymerase sigma-70 factor (ECF subfamily)